MPPRGPAQSIKLILAKRPVQHQTAIPRPRITVVIQPIIESEVRLADNSETVKKVARLSLEDVWHIFPGPFFGL